VVLGSSNPKKIEEIRRMLSATRVCWRPLSEFPHAQAVAEDGRTFEENAVKKATLLARALNRWVLADDSGLEVDHLNGAPGVLSHRYAGDPPDDERNNQKLLAALKDVPAAERGARFRCVIALASPEGPILSVEGRCTGSIAFAPRGSNDFGYDPVFFYAPLNRTFAELLPREKDRVSHRGSALQAFIGRWHRLIEKSNTEAPVTDLLGADSLFAVRAKDGPNRRVPRSEAWKAERE
jgi:XTP/dITP diphosphohydrolase